MPSSHRIAITLGDPRGIGPEIVARALAEPPGAEVTVIGAEDQIAWVPAARRISVGAWGAGSGERIGGGASAAAERARTVRAGQLTGHAVERAARLRSLDGQENHFPEAIHYR